MIRKRLRKRIEQSFLMLYTLIKKWQYAQLIFKFCFKFKFKKTNNYLRDSKCKEKEGWYYLAVKKRYKLLRGITLIKMLRF